MRQEGGINCQICRDAPAHSAQLPLPTTSYRKASNHHPPLKKSTSSQSFDFSLTTFGCNRGCEQNQASYNVFQLDAFVNTSKIADLKQFPKVSTAIDAISVSGRTLLSLTQSIQNILENMLQTSSFNLTTYRSSVGAPTPEKDLATFIDQMQRVALQVRTPAAAAAQPSGHPAD